LSYAQSFAFVIHDDTDLASKPKNFISKIINTLSSCAKAKKIFLLEKCMVTNDYSKSHRKLIVANIFRHSKLKDQNYHIIFVNI